MKQLLDSLKEMIDWVTPFSKTISHIHCNLTPEKHLYLAAPSKDRSIEFQAVSKTPCQDIQGVACLGSLPYLRQIINSSFLNASCEVNISYDTSGKHPSVRTIKFTNGDKMEMQYTATNPYMNNFLVMPSKQKIDSWPVTFILDKYMVDKIAEMKTIQAAAPGKNANDVELLTFVCEKSGNLNAIFGDERNPASLYLTNEVERLDQKNGFRAAFIIDQFIRLGQMIDWSKAKDGVPVQLANTSLKIMIESSLLEHDIIMTAKKKAER